MDHSRLHAWVEPTIVTAFEPPPYDPSAARNTLDAAARSADDHTRFLQRWNGCYAFGGALHVLGARLDRPNQSLDLWNRHDGWRQAFGHLVDQCWFFAQSAFGDQFGYRDARVVRLRPLDGRVEPVAPNFAQWIEAVFLDPQRWLSLDLYESSVRRLGPLEFGGHFGAPDGWPLASPLTVEAVEVLPARDNLERRGAAALAAPSQSRLGADRTR
jgi:hypothetical protein